MSWDSMRNLELSNFLSRTSDCKSNICATLVQFAEHAVILGPPREALLARDWRLSDLTTSTRNSEDKRMHQQCRTRSTKPQRSTKPLHVTVAL